jgi:hypothetical protein
VSTKKTWVVRRGDNSRSSDIVASFSKEEDADDYAIRMLNAGWKFLHVKGLILDLHTPGRRGEAVRKKALA